MAANGIAKGKGNRFWVLVGAAFIAGPATAQELMRGALERWLGEYELAG
jgi:hypothetical protein